MPNSRLGPMDEVMLRLESEEMAKGLRLEFPSRQRTAVATVVGNGLVQIGGQYYDSLDKVGSEGDVVEVVNAGRPGSALYANAAVSASLTATRRTSTTTAGGGGGGGSGGTVADHGLLLGLADDDHLQYFNQSRGDARYVVRTRLVTGVAPLRVNGSESSDLSSNIAVSLLLATDPGLEVVTNALLVKRPANSGIVRNSSGLSLSPAAVSASTINSVSGDDHVHRVLASSAPGADEWLLKSDASGFLELVRLIASNRVRTPLVDTASGDLVLDPASGITRVDDDLLVGQDAAVTRHMAVASNVLLVDGLNKVIGVNVTPDGAAALDIRAGTTSDHSQRIRRISGQTGRLWRIEDTSGNELIVMDSVGNLQSGMPGFVSGLTGWRIEPVGDVEFNNGKFRGELHATVFVFDEVNVQNGTLLVTPKGGSIEIDSTLTTSVSIINRNVRTTAFSDQDYLDVETTEFGDQTFLDSQTQIQVLHVQDPQTGHFPIFTTGETLRMKAWTGTFISDTWMVVGGSHDEGTHFSYTVTVMSGTLPVTYTPGAAIAGYGEDGDGFVRISADDAYGPLIDVATRGLAPWSGADIYPHVRLGRLDGVGVPGVSGILQWGLIAGANLADANSPYVVLSNLQQYMYKVQSEWHDGVNTTGRIEASGRVRFGTNVDNPATTFMDVNPHTGLATFRGAIEILAGTIPSGVVSGLGALATKDSVALNTTEVTNKSLANLDSAANTKLSGIAAGATVGAHWVNNLDGIPARYNTPSPSTPGLYLNSDYMGYYNAGWKVYIRNNGLFGFAGDANNFVIWDGTTLAIGGSLQVGAGVKDSTLTGWHVSSGAGGEIVGQASGVDQVVMGTDGKITAGAGAVLLDASGVSVQGGATTYSILVEPGTTPTPYSVTEARKIKYGDLPYGTRTYGRKTTYVWPDEVPNPIRNDVWHELVIDAVKPSDITGGSWPTNNYFNYSRLWVRLDEVVVTTNAERLRVDNTGVAIAGVLKHNNKEVVSVETTAW